MTISSTLRKAGPWVGAGTATQFAFTFKVLATSDISVIMYDTATYTEEILVLDLDYTVALSSNQDTAPGGTVTLSDVLATGYNLVIIGAEAYTQPVSLINQGAFLPSVLNGALDRCVIQIQQLYEMLTRAAVLPVSSDVSVEIFTGYVLLLGANYDTIIAAATGTSQVYRELDLQSALVFTSDNSMQVSIFATPSGADQDVSSSGEFPDGAMLVISNTGTEYNLIFQNEYITPGTKQIFSYNGYDGIWI